MTNMIPRNITATSTLGYLKSFRVPTGLGMRSLLFLVETTSVLGSGRYVSGRKNKIKVQMQKINMATNQKVDRHPNLSVRYPPIIGLKALFGMMLDAIGLIHTL